jgi:CheY-like chemotaxis protein
MPAQKRIRNEIVLLADSDADTRTMYSEFFRFHGYRVVSVLTGRDALALAPRVDLVVTESLLPGDMDGLELVTRLKGDELTARLPVVVVTACAWNTDRDRARRAGCDLYFSKPCLPHDLMRAIRRLLGASKLRRAERKARTTVPAPIPPHLLSRDALLRDA